MTTDDRFDDPHFAINRVYTRSGDDGTTALIGGKRVGKDDLRVESYGCVDELIAYVGLARAYATTLLETLPTVRTLVGELLGVQHCLYNLGAQLATPSGDVNPRQPRIRAEDTDHLEQSIDRANGELPALRSFVIPGSTELSAQLHVCRAVCRRAERLCVGLDRRETVDPLLLRYLNRLSDALFVWSRWADLLQQREETLWDPNHGNT